MSSDELSNIKFDYPKKLQNNGDSANLFQFTLRSRNPSRDIKTEIHQNIDFMPAFNLSSSTNNNLSNSSHPKFLNENDAYQLGNIETMRKLRSKKGRLTTLDRMIDPNFTMNSPKNEFDSKKKLIPEFPPLKSPKSQEKDLKFFSRSPEYTPRDRLAGSKLPFLKKSDSFLEYLFRSLNFKPKSFLRSNERANIKKILFPDNPKSFKTEPTQEETKEEPPKPKRQSKLTKYLANIFSRKKSIDTGIQNMGSKKNIASKRVNMTEEIPAREEPLKKIPSHKLAYSQSYKVSKDKVQETEEENKISEFLPSFNIEYSVKTKAGKGSNQKTKINQDNFFIKRNLCGNNAISLFLVFDGHGPEGHKVSEFLRDDLGVNIESLLNTSNSKDATKIKECLEKACQLTSERLEKSNFDNKNSGSTCTGILIYESTIFTINLGDSRTVLGKIIKEELKSEALTRDHCPTMQDEKKRILASGGRIHQYRDDNGTPVGPARIWLAKRNVPGLAMTRSFGDNVAKEIGKSSEPEIKERLLNPSIDKSIVIASDGIWEFISNHEAISMVHPFIKDKRPDLAATKLVRIATSNWKKEDNVIDDITCIVIFFYQA